MHVYVVKTRFKNTEMNTFVVRKLFTVLFIVFCVHRGDSFYVERSGNTQVKPGEISVIFYMTVANGEKHTVTVNSKNTKCCWIHPGSSSKYDCESMDLLGGIPVTLQPSKKGNISYIFTNLYPMDRVGQCVFHLWDGDIKIAHTIRFNTTLPKDTSWLRSLYKSITGEYDDEDRVCDTMDLDPRRKCTPVNCVQKYNGKRNYFRKETKYCEPVHECFTKTDDDNLPTTAFDKDHNRCKSLIQTQLSKEEEGNMKKDIDMSMEDSQRKKFKDINPDDPIPVRCNHGKRVGSICVCEDGWKTDTSKVPLGDPKFVYDWCNVKTRKKPFLSYKKQKNFMIAGLSLTSVTLFVAWLWVLYSYFYRHEIFQATEKRVPKRPTPPNKRNLLATNALMKELSDKNILKRRKLAAEKRLYSVGHVADKSSVDEDDSNVSASEGVSTTPFEDDKSSTNVQSAAQKGERTPNKSHSTPSLSNTDNDILSIAEGSKLPDKKSTKSFPRSSLKGPATDSRTEQTSNVAIRGTPEGNAEAFVSEAASKVCSTYSGVAASLYGTPAQDDGAKMPSAVSRSAFSPTSEASGVSTMDTSGAMISASKISRHGSVFLVSSQRSSNVQTEASKQGTLNTTSTTSRFSQIPHSPYTHVSETRSTPATDKAEGDNMSSTSQSANAQSPYTLVGEASNSSFVGNLINNDQQSIVSSESHSSKSPVLYSLSGHQSTQVTKKQSPMSWSQSMKSGASAKSIIKDVSSSLSTAATGQTQKPMVIALQNSSSDSD